MHPRHLNAARTAYESGRVMLKCCTRRVCPTGAGTGPEVYGNTNAPPAVTSSAVIYALRCMVPADIPLNQVQHSTLAGCVYSICSSHDCSGNQDTASWCVQPQLVGVFVCSGRPQLATRIHQLAS